MTSSPHGIGTRSAVTTNAATAASARTAPIAGNRRSTIGVAAVVAGLVAVVFISAFGLYRFFDDWAFPAAAEQALRTGAVWTFITSPLGRHWSPIWNALVLINFKVAGWDSDLFVRSLMAAVLVVALVWFTALARAFRLSRPALLFGLAIVALHPRNAVTLYSFDTYAQAIADLSTWAIGGLGLLAVFETEGRGRRLWTAAALLPVGLLVKEQAVSGAACLLAALAAIWFTDAQPARRKRYVMIGVLITGIVGTFAAVRAASLSVPETEGAFQWCARCVAPNEAELTLGLFVPTPSILIFDSLRANPTDILALSLTATATVLVFFFFIAGLWRTSRPRWVALVIIYALLAGVPVVLLNRVGLLWEHTWVFWFALLFAEALDGWRARLHGAGARRVLAAAAIAYVVALGWGLRYGLGEMRATGERARAALERYAGAIEALPDRSVVVILVEDVERAPSAFSLYRVVRPERLVLLHPGAVQHLLPDRGITVVTAAPGEDTVELDNARAAGRPAFTLRRTGDLLVTTPIAP